MKTILGLVCIIFGIIFGLWVGIWWAFIGGIIDVVNAFKMTDISAAAVAIGLAKVFFAGFIGWCGGIIPVMFGMALIR